MKAAALLLLALTAPLRAEDAPTLLPWSEQVRVREGFLETRHAGLLALLRKHHLDWWIVVNEEFHDDPLVAAVAPPRPYAGNRDYFVFIDAGEKGLRRVAITGFSEESLTRFFEAPTEPKPADKVFPELYAQYPPKRIGLGISGRRGVMRTLTYDTYQTLSRILGPDRKSVV